ncbi:MAG: GlxA family transcriptional regulator [Pseudomonadota bacterium]
MKATEVLKPRAIGFLLCPGFSLMSFSSAIEPLRAANQLSEKALYTWSIFSPTGENLMTRHNLEMHVDAGLNEWPDGLDYLFTVAGSNAYTFTDRKVYRWLNAVAARKTVVGGISSGSYILANAGLLDGYRCTIHWDDMPAFVEAFPHLDTSYSLFEFDRDRITSSGGTSSMDMMLQLISDQHGAELAARITTYFQHDRMRTSDDRQQRAEYQALARKSTKLAKAVVLMSNNIEEPIRPADIARQIGLSQRQLERLFHNYCHCTPQKYYMKVRVQHSRNLLLETEMTVMEVATATGFTTQSHFTKCFRDQFDVTPQRFRLQH